MVSRRTVYRLKYGIGAVLTAFSIGAASVLFLDLDKINRYFKPDKHPVEISFVAEPHTLRYGSESIVLPEMTFGPNDKTCNVRYVKEPAPNNLTTTRRLRECRSTIVYSDETIGSGHPSKVRLVFSDRTDISLDLRLEDELAR